MKKVFLDDYRKPSDIFYLSVDFNYQENNDWLIIKSYDEFILYINESGLPDLISFDHDLSQDHYLPENQHEIKYDSIEKTGYHALKWLITYCEQNKLSLPVCKVHSQNIIGKNNMLELIEQNRKK
jgi:hypothetical protein